MIIVTILSVALLVVCGVLVFLVLSQDARGGGLAGALGGGAVQGAFGGKSAESITKLTAYIAVAFFVLILTMGMLQKRDDVGVAPVVDDSSPAAPSAPAAPEPE